MIQSSALRKFFIYSLSILYFSSYIDICHVPLLNKGIMLYLRCLQKKYENYCTWKYAWHIIHQMNMTLPERENNYVCAPSTLCMTTTWRMITVSAMWSPISRYIMHTKLLDKTMTWHKQTNDMNTMYHICTWYMTCFQDHQNKIYDGMVRGMVTTWIRNCVVLYMYTELIWPIPREGLVF